MAEYHIQLWSAIPQSCSEGIYAIDGMSAVESIAVLDKMIAVLGDDVDDDYWQPTEGNAKRALLQLKAMAQMRPDGEWKVWA